MMPTPNSVSPVEPWRMTVKPRRSWLSTIFLPNASGLTPSTAAADCATADSTNNSWNLLVSTKRGRK
jgi:hypothetical protein